MSGPFAPPPGGGPGGPPNPGFQQPPWQPKPQEWPAGPPPKRGTGWKWLLAAVALLAVVGVAVAVTASVVGGNGADSQARPSPTNNGSNPDIASADDTGPVGVITEDASCGPMRPIQEMWLAAQRNGWVERDPTIPSSQWNAETRTQYEAVGRSMREAADRVVPIAKLTPHRAMRELYEQFIAYSRAYADSLPSYTAADDNLARVAIGASDAISFICAAVDFGSAAARGPLVPSIEAPEQVTPTRDSTGPQQFITEPNSVCVEWSAVWSQFTADTATWRSTNPDISASQWSAEQHAINDEVAPVMSRFAQRTRELGQQSGNTTFKDFADLSAQYRTAYVEALPTYMPADKYLANTSAAIASLVDAACRVVEP